MGTQRPNFRPAAYITFLGELRLTSGLKQGKVNWLVGAWIIGIFMCGVVGKAPEFIVYGRAI